MGEKNNVLEVEAARYAQAVRLDVLRLLLSAQSVTFDDGVALMDAAHEAARWVLTGDEPYMAEPPEPPGYAVLRGWAEGENGPAPTVYIGAWGDGK